MCVVSLVESLPDEVRPPVEEFLPPVVVEPPPGMRACARRCVSWTIARWSRDGLTWLCGWVCCTDDWASRCVCLLVLCVCARASETAKERRLREKMARGKPGGGGAGGVAKSTAPVPLRAAI